MFTDTQEQDLVKEIKELKQRLKILEKRPKPYKLIMYQFFIIDEESGKKFMLDQYCHNSFNRTLSHGNAVYTLNIGLKYLPNMWVTKDRQDWERRGITWRSARLLIYRSGSLVWQGLVGANETKVIIN